MQVSMVDYNQEPAPFELGEIKQDRMGLARSSLLEIARVAAQRNFVRFCDSAAVYSVK
jgi:hypothetical protein